MKRVLITGEFDSGALVAELNLRGVQSIHIPKPRSSSQIRFLLSEVTHYILGGPEYLDAALLASANQLRYIVVLGTGTSSFIDEEAAKNLKITVENTPAQNAEAVAEFALGAILALASGFVSSQEKVRSQTEWVQKPRKSLNDLTFGIIGLGNTGSALVKRLQKVTSKPIVYYTRTRRLTQENKNLVYQELDEILSTVDFASIHLKYCPQTHYLIGTRQLDGRNPKLSLLNFSNPKIVDPVALSVALRQNSIRLGYIDGYYQEWEANTGGKGDPYQLLDLPSDRFLATSHIAAQEAETVQALFMTASRKLFKQLDETSG